MVKIYDTDMKDPPWSDHALLRMESEWKRALLNAGKLQRGSGTISQSTACDSRLTIDLGKKGSTRLRPRWLGTGSASA